LTARWPWQGFDLIVVSYSSLQSFSGQTEVPSLLHTLQQRYSEVLLREDGRYEIGGRLLLHAGEAQALVDNKVTLEEIVMYRHQPTHLMPPHVRLALSGAV